ncbi:hypothetical protein I4U23_001044 [Adineta vaga]|nr:hypothetical protein I4U23_001044 [Adineta vaga]
MRVSSIGKGLRQIPTARSRLCEHLSVDDNDILTSCRQRMYVTCPHCQRSLCLHHINEHQLMIRNSFDSLVDRLNEYQYDLTIKLSIPATSRAMVDDCLNEYKNIIVPYVQRTCCQNDVKQDDVDRIQIFINRMSSVIRLIESYWDNVNNNSKRLKTSDDPENPDNSLSSSKRTRIDR